MTDNVTDLMCVWQIGLAGCLQTFLGDAEEKQIIRSVQRMEPSIRFYWKSRVKQDVLLLITGFYNVTGSK